MFAVASYLAPSRPLLHRVPRTAAPVLAALEAGNDEAQLPCLAPESLVAVCYNEAVGQKEDCTNDISRERKAVKRGNIQEGG